MLKSYANIEGQLCYSSSTYNSVKRKHYMLHSMHYENQFKKTKKKIIYFSKVSNNFCVDRCCNDLTVGCNLFFVLYAF